MLGLLIRLFNGLLADIVAPGGSSHVIKGVVTVVIRLRVEYLFPLLVVVKEKSSLDLHWSIAELNLPSGWSSMVVSVMLLRSVSMRCVVVLVMILREIANGGRRGQLLLETSEAIIVSSKAVLDVELVLRGFEEERELVENGPLIDLSHGCLVVHYRQVL